MNTDTLKKASSVLEKSASYLWKKISKDSTVVKVSVPHNPNMSKNGLIEAERSMSQLSNRLNKDEKFNIRIFETHEKPGSRWDEFKHMIKKATQKVHVPIKYTYKTNITPKEIEMMIIFETDHDFHKSDFLRLKHEEFHSQIHMDVLSELFNLQKKLHGRFLNYESDQNFLPGAAH